MGWFENYKRGQAARRRRSIGFWKPVPMVRGPGGRFMCRNECGLEVKPPRITFCGDSCIEEFKFKKGDGVVVRAVLLRRDQGICALCGEDTIALKAEYEEIRDNIGGRYWIRRGDYQKDRPLENFLRFHKIPYGRINSEWWDADHIVPIIEGGGYLASNYRTLCIPCHVGETRKLRQRLRQAAASV